MRRSVRGAVAAAVTAGVLVLAPAGAGAQVGGDPEVVAGGLDNPRGLTIAPDGTLWVAEAGTGGAGPCFEGPEGPACYGESSSLTRIGAGGPERVVTGIPSLAAADGSAATGAHDLAVVVPDGYWVASADGHVVPFGDPSAYGDLQDVRLGGPVVGLVPSPTGLGYWMAAADGGVFGFGAARFHGSAGGTALAAPVVGMAATPSGGGYWLVGADGGVFAYGDAGFHGSASTVALAAPIVGIAATPSGGGYWLVAADGGVFTYGDAGFYGSTGGVRLVSPVSGIAATASGGGYWLVAEDGGVFTYGDAPFHGSAGGTRLAEPVTGIAPTPSEEGYRLFAADGGVFTYGDASFHGSAVGEDLGGPVVGGGSPPVTIQFVVGLAADPAIRSMFPGGAGFATLNVVTGAGWTTVADLGEYEAETDADGDVPGTLPDSNPYSLLAGVNVTWVADAGANTIVAVVGGEPFTHVEFPFLPPAAPNPNPVDPVPNSIAESPDGEVYVGQLTGFPFSGDVASVHHVDFPDADDEPPTLEVFRSGFTKIIDLAFAPDGGLYVLEHAGPGLPPSLPGTGRLLHVSADGATETVVADDLDRPGSVVVDEAGAVYVANCGSCAAGEGEILRWPAAGG